ncbi:MAG: hypothetical protein LBS36_03155 [Oscillospiraceae bacterium]|nr:hypothetical protein [Oscillospiraceae bacterium]
MKKKTAFALGVAAGAAGVIYAKKQLGKEENQRIKYDVQNTAIQGLLKGISTVLPDVPREDVVTYGSEGFMEGHSVLIDKAAKGAKWKLGFAKVSVLPEDVGIGEYYIGGYLSMPPNIAEGVLDDQVFRCICLDDGSGRGAAVFGVLDCVGISGSDVRAIRGLLKGFAAENNIVSINISATHSHSCIDTQGLWGNLGKAFKENVRGVLKGQTEGFVSGRNEKFMNELHEKAAETIKTAFYDMKAGTLYRATADASHLVRDKRPPNVTVDEITTLHFVPDDKEAKGTRVAFLAAHPVSFGDKNKTVSADFPYYICEGFENMGDNGLYFQGPQAAVATSRGSVVPAGTPFPENIIEYGHAIARYCAELDKSQYEKVEPILNVRTTEVFLPISNYLFFVLAKLQVVNNLAVRVGKKKSDLRFITEIGYVELGKNMRFALMPGEVMPEIFEGGAYQADKAYNHYDWNYPALKDVVEGTLFGIGLCNDSIGYVVPDNDFGSVTAPLHYEESVSTGEKTASTLVKAFINLVENAQELKKA